MARNTTMTETLNDAFEDVRSEARSAAEEAARDVLDTLRDAPYAALGSISVGFRRAREAAEKLSELPQRARKQLDAAPERMRENYRERVDAGHSLVERVLGRKSVDDARQKARSARAAARRATSSVKGAAKATARAAADATSAIDSSDNRPYEERTVEELYELAASREIDGRSQMNKSELIAALRADR